MHRFLYPDAKQSIAIHDEVIRRTKGAIGIHNADVLYSALDFITDDEFYPEFVDKVAHLMFSIAKGHCFVDGNKRAAISVAAFFLEINSYDQYTINVFMGEMEDIILLTVLDIIDKNELANIINEILELSKLGEGTKGIFVSKLKKVYADQGALWNEENNSLDVHQLENLLLNLYQAV